MNILYGVVGEGMGHATRSEGIIRHLLDRGHTLVILASGKAEPYLAKTFADQATVDKISGLFMKYGNNRVKFRATLGALLGALPGAVIINWQAMKRLDGLQALPAGQFDAVVTDFESLAHLYGKLNKIPIVNIDNMSIIPRCDHREIRIPAVHHFDRLVSDLIVRAKVRKSDAYLITTFFFPPVKAGYRKNTFLFPPILRPEIFAIGARPPKLGEHILVYQTSESFLALLEILNGLGRQFVVYGFDPEKYQPRFPRLAFKGRDREGFFRDLAGARAIITGGGFTLMSEAVYLGKPVLSIPVEKQFEQILNALYLEHLGYGIFVPGQVLKKDAAAFRKRLDEFLGNLDGYREKLADYRREHPQTDNSAILAKLDEILAGFARHR